MRLRCLVLAFAAAGLCTVQADSVDDEVARQMALHSIPGLSLAIFDHGQIVKAKGYGLANRETGAPVTTDTLFQAGSVSKPVSAVGILQQVEAGRLSLDGDIDATLKSWHIPASPFTATQKVTVRRLLSHTAGTNIHGFHGYERGKAAPTLVKVLNGTPPANSEPIVVDLEPGSTWRYSGGGYVILLQAFLDATGQPFPDYMAEHVFKPLGMTHSTFEQPLPSARWAEAATGYIGGAPVPHGWHVYPELTAAGLWTTPSDLARFALGLQAAWADHGQVLSQAMARTMLTPHQGQWGLGIGVQGKGSAQHFSHNGRNEGFDTLLVGYCETGQGAAIMINRNDDSPAMKHIADAIAAQYAWRGYKSYRPPPAIKDPNPVLATALTGILVAAAEGDFVPALFTERMSAALPASLEDGSSFRTSLDRFGPLHSIEALGQIVHGSATEYRYRAIFEHATAVVSCTTLADGKIAGLWVVQE